MYTLPTMYTMMPSQKYSVTGAQSANAKRLAASLARAEHAGHRQSTHQALGDAERRRLGDRLKAEMPVPWKPEAWTLAKAAPKLPKGYSAPKLPKGYHILKPGQALPKGAKIVPSQQLAAMPPGLVTPPLGAGSHMLDGEEEGAEEAAAGEEGGAEGEEGEEGAAEDEEGEEGAAEGEEAEEGAAGGVQEEEPVVVEMTPHERIDFAHKQHMLARMERIAAREENKKVLAF